MYICNNLLAGGRYKVTAVQFKAIIAMFLQLLTGTCNFLSVQSLHIYLPIFAAVWEIN